jgi:hypothetical protein
MSEWREKGGVSKNDLDQMAETLNRFAPPGHKYILRKKEG